MRGIPSKTGGVPAEFRGQDTPMSGTRDTMRQEIGMPNEVLANEPSWRGAVSSTRTTKSRAPAEEPRLTSLSLYSWSSPPNVGMDHNANQCKDREGPPQGDTRDQGKLSEEHTRNPHRKDCLRQVSQELGDKLHFILARWLHELSIARTALLSNVRSKTPSSPSGSRSLSRSASPSPPCRRRSTPSCPRLPVRTNRDETRYLIPLGI